MLVREAIKSRRIEKGMSQSELAERVGCTTAHISAVEAGKRGTTLSLVERIESALDLESGKLQRLWREEKGIVVIDSFMSDPSPSTAIAIVLDDPKDERPLTATDMSKWEREGKLEYVHRDLVDLYTFVFVAQDNDMAPEIRKGDRLVIRPCRQENLEGGEYVFISVDDSYTVRRYVHSGSARILDTGSLTSAPEHLKVDELNRIKGVVLEVRRYFPWTFSKDDK